MLELPIPRVVRPIKLARAVSKLSAQSDGLVAGNAEWERIEAEVLDHLGRTSSSRPGRKQLRVLIHLVSSNDARLGDQDERAVRCLVEEVGRLRPRQVFQLYASRPEPGIRDLLLRRVRQFEERGRDLRRLPSWLPIDSAKLAQCLEDPLPYLDPFVRKKGVPLPELVKATEVNPDSALGRGCYPTLIRLGSAEWWKAQVPKDVRDWAAERPPEVFAAVAERQLVDLEQQGLSNRELTASVEARDLRRWVEERLGHPDVQAQRWSLLSEAARDVMRRLFVAREIEKILRGFRKQANEDRARYWNWFVDHIEDAFLLETEPVVCIMALHRLLFVEFGETGWALRVFRRTRGSLVAALGTRSHVPQDFRKRQHLQLGTEMTPLVMRLSHTHGWQDKLDDYMREEGVLE